MGWVVEYAPEHEGSVANVLADGRLGVSTVAGGVVLADLREADLHCGWGQRRGSGLVEVVVPWDQVVAWRGRCTCGWTGPSRPAVVSDVDGSRECSLELGEEVFLPAWRTHVAPLASLPRLVELTTQLEAVQASIAENVRLARAGGASWLQIGHAVGLTRQGAQQRWG